MCDICNNESPDSKDVGVAAVPAAPVSVMWCQNCLCENAVPMFVAQTWLFSEFEQYNLTMPDEPPESTLADWALEMTVWLDNRYQKIRDALPELWRIQREMLAKEA
jgi:hypothetical protein